MDLCCTEAYLGKVIGLVFMAKLGFEHRPSKLFDISSSPLDLGGCITSSRQEFLERREIQEGTETAGTHWGYPGPAAQRVSWEGSLAIHFTLTRPFRRGDACLNVSRGTIVWSVLPASLGKCWMELGEWSRVRSLGSGARPLEFEFTSHVTLHETIPTSWGCC